MNILYLDYNGVLHDSKVLRNRQRGLYLATEGKAFFEWMPILEQLLAPAPDLKIVLSTSWVRAVDFDAAKFSLSLALRERVIGATFLHPGVVQSAFDMTPRGLQILADIERRRPTNWFALDDDDSGWPAAQRHHLIQTDGALGLSDPAIQQTVRDHLVACQAVPPAA